MVNISRYPTEAEITTAKQRRLDWWLRFLDPPKTDEERRLRKLMNERYKEVSPCPR